MFGLLVPRTGATQKKSPQPLWEVDLADFGCQAVPDPWKEVGGEFAPWRYQQGLIFTQPNVLAAYFVVYNGNGQLSARAEPLISDPYHLRALFFDAGRGTAVKRGEWPARPWKYSYLFGAEQGRFIIAAAGRISLYSPDLALLSQYEPPSGASALGWMAYASPTGKSLLVSYYEPPVGRGFARLLLLDTSNLSRTGTWTTQRPFDLAVWNDEVAWAADGSIYVWEPGTEPRVLARGAFLGGPVSFLSSTTLAARAGLNPGADLVILSTEGTILRRIEFGREFIGPWVVPSRDGRFFAVESYVPGWFDSPMPRRITVRVFSLDSEKSLLSVNVPQGLAFALSPEGSLLAVRARTLLRVYRVPRPAYPDRPAARR